MDLRTVIDTYSHHPNCKDLKAFASTSEEVEEMLRTISTELLTNYTPDTYDLYGCIHVHKATSIESIKKVITTQLKTTTGIWVARNFEPRNLENRFHHAVIYIHKNVIKVTEFNGQSKNDATIQETTVERWLQNIKEFRLYTYELKVNVEELISRINKLKFSYQKGSYNISTHNCEHYVLDLLLITDAITQSHKVSRLPRDKLVAYEFISYLIC